MKKFLTTAIALMAFLSVAQSAQAATVEGSIDVIAYGPGKLTGPGIDCGSGATDCAESASWDDGQAAPVATLTVTATKPGYEITSWGNCPTRPSMSVCQVPYSASPKQVIAWFFDVQPPSVFINGYTPKGRDFVNVQVQTSDNDKVTKVEYLLDDEVVLTKTSDFGMTDIDTSQATEGDHTIQVRAWDDNHNSTLSVQHTIEVDHTAPRVELVDPVAATNGDSVSFALAFPDGGVWNSYCALQKKGETKPLPDPDDENTYCWDDAPYTAAVTDEGAWEFVVEATDSVGNETRVVHEFVVDRTAPEAAFTGGPDEGSEVGAGEVTFAWSANDGLPLTQACVWDHGEAGECDGSATGDLAPGRHAFKVVLTDQAGNQTVLARTFTVKEPDADPDPSDRTAPAVKLVAPKQTVKTARKKLRLKVRCNEACSGKVVVKGKRGVKFSGRVSLAKAGVAKLKLRPTAKVRRRLATISTRALRTGRSRSLALTATANLRDLAGNVGKASLKFKVGA
ncbi:MAG: hypothetical protein J0H66_09000 [Solirubrobacterales bacterium]|nr:hypothetical protein [Solirubrobacterales bacterium]OJU95789.1 MAG: hypothetical protein BGO23_09385 [Solirubrobacterales bacterium 67-14]